MSSGLYQRKNKYIFFVFEQEILHLYVVILTTYILNQRSKNMVNRFLLFCSLIVPFSLGIHAQSELTLKNNMMFTDVIISHNGTSHQVQTLIDTGASVCMIDSTYAVDSCNIILPESNATIGNTFGKRIKAVDLNLDSISLGGFSYSTIRCFVIDLKSKFQQYTPNFILGGDFLKREIWEFNLKEKYMAKFERQKKNIQSIIKWKNHDDYKDAFLNSIYLNGKIAGKKARILFDTGYQRNIIPDNFGIIPNKEIEVTCGDIANQLAKEKTGLCENIDVEIDKYKTSLDFRFKNTKYPRMNSFLFKEKDFALDYKKKCIYICK